MAALRVLDAIEIRRLRIRGGVARVVRDVAGRGARGGARGRRLRAAAYQDRVVPDLATRRAGRGRDLGVFHAACRGIEGLRLPGYAPCALSLFVLFAFTGIVAYRVWLQPLLAAWFGLV